MSAQNEPSTLVEIRQFVAEERAVAEHGDEAVRAVRSRNAVLALCDVAETLLAVVEHLPRCEGMAGCGLLATRVYTPPGHREFLCDGHNPLDPLFAKCPYRRRHIDDMPYAATLRALLGSGK